MIIKYFAKHQLETYRVIIAVALLWSERLECQPFVRVKWRIVGLPLSDLSFPVALLCYGWQARLLLGVTCARGSWELCKNVCGVVHVKPANKVVKTEPAECKRRQSVTGCVSLCSGVGIALSEKAFQHKIQRMSSFIDEFCWSLPRILDFLPFGPFCKAQILMFPLIHIPGLQKSSVVSSVISYSRDSY